MSKGWISVHRQIWNSWVWDEKPFSKGQAWIDLLLLANHEDRKVLVGNQLVIVKRGSFITSQTKLMERWGWGKEKLRNFLRLLESDEMIEVDTTPRYTHIAITNYETYQTQYQNQTNENPVIPINREEYQTKDRPKTDQRQTANRPNTDRTPTTNNNDNNLNNDNKDIYIKSDSTNPTQPTEQTNRTNIVGTPQERIFQRWNSKGIIQHRKLTDKIKRAINGALKDYSEEEICQAIDNYAVILADDRYYWSYKWGLKEFLQRGLDKFLDFDVAAQNYRKDYREKQKLNKQTDFNKFEQHEYTADELESLFMKIEGG